MDETKEGPGPVKPNIVDQYACHLTGFMDKVVTRMEEIRSLGMPLGSKRPCWIDSQYNDCFPFFARSREFEYGIRLPIGNAVAVTVSFLEDYQGERDSEYIRCTFNIPRWVFDDDDWQARYLAEAESDYAQAKMNRIVGDLYAYRYLKLKLEGVKLDWDELKAKAASLC